jgi:SAM-dependent methyltransferase
MRISKWYKLVKRNFGRVLLGRNPFDLAYFFCRGEGLEVGARNNPYPFGKTCKVTYADIGDEFQIENSLRHGFRLGPLRERLKYVKVNHILSGPKYGFESIEDNFYDFIYTDNVLEHTPNPIYCLVEQLRVAKIGGFVYAVIPNKFFTFDINRNPTPIELLISKYQNNIFEYSVDEALDIINNTKDFPFESLGVDTPLTFAKKMIVEDAGAYHFHVFDITNTLEMLRYVCRETASSLKYFSAPDGKHIHFSICKGSI